MSKPRFNGIVVKNSMDKTAVVEVQRKTAHPKYGKEIILRKRYFAHTEEKLDIGSKVTIQLSKPISKRKRWIIVDKSKSIKNKKK